MFIEFTTVNKDIAQKDKIIDELLQNNATLDSEVTIAQEEYANKKARTDTIRNECETEKAKRPKLMDEIMQVEAQIAEMVAEQERIRNSSAPKPAKSSLLKTTGPCL